MKKLAVAIIAIVLPNTSFAADVFTSLKSVTLSNQALEGLLAEGAGARILNAPLEGVGSGFDIFTGELKNPECIKSDALSDDSEENNGIKNPSFFHQVENITQFREESQIGASATLTYKVFSVGFSHEQLNGSYFNSYDRYAYMYSRVTTKSKTLKALALTKDAKDLLASDPKAFRVRCGDAFVKGYELGGIFSAVIRIHTTEDTKYATNKTTISAGISGLLGGHFEKDSAYDKMTAVANVTTDYINDGGIEGDPTPQTATEYFKAFRVKAKANPVRVAYITAPYSDLFDQDVDKLPKITQEMLEVVAVLAEKRETARQTLNDLMFATQHPSVFSDKPDTVPSKITGAQTYILSIAKSVDVCHDATDLKDCKIEIGNIGDPPRSGLTEAPAATPAAAH